MQPTATITDITHAEIDTIIIWHDGQRPIAYAYRGGRVIRTTPLDPAGDLIAQARGAFRAGDGQTFAFGDMHATTVTAPPAMQPAGAGHGPSRWS